MIFKFILTNLTFSFKESIDNRLILRDKTVLDSKGVAKGGLLLGG